MSRLKAAHESIWESLKQRSAPPVLQVVRPDRYRNKTERAYAELLKLRVRIGEVREWFYESLKFRNAEGAWFTPDFYVILADDVEEIHEVKGFLRPAERLRFLHAREKYTRFRWKMIERDGHSWRERTV